MAWFLKKAEEEAPPPPPDPREVARAKAEELLNTHPSFHISTVDGLAWICPFTGAKIPAPFGHFEVARDYLTEKRPWERFKPKAPEELQRWRWVLHLRDHSEEEPRLKLFSKDGRWLNPYTGKWVALPPQARSPQAVLDVLGRLLATCPEAQSGRLIDEKTLDERYAAAVPNGQRYRAVDEIEAESMPTSATQRLSGSRASERDVLKQARPAQSHSDLDRAKGIIEKMLPVPPTVPGYGVMVHYEPHSQVGGDFFDFLPMPDGSHLAVLGDVAGHGVQGALVVVAALKALRFIAPQHQDLVPLLSAWNDEVRKDLLQGQFITVFAARFHPGTHRAELVCCGHQPALLASPTRRTVLEQVGQTGPALGLMSSAMFGRALKPVVLTLEPGDVLVNYTDGLNEAKDRQGREYGQFRTMGALITHLEQPYDHLVKLMVGEAKSFADDRLEDDLTVVCLTRERPHDETDTDRL